MTPTPTRDEAVLRIMDDLRPYASKTLGSIRIGVDEVKTLVDWFDATAPAPASGRVDAVANGWLFTTPDSGVEWSEQHPIESGEVPDAQDLRPATLGNLLFELTYAWTVIASLSPAATPVSEAEPVAFPADGELLNMEDGERANAFWRWSKAAGLPLHMAESGLNRFHADDRAEWAWQAWCAALSPAATPVSEAEPDWMEAQQVRKRRGVEIMQEYAWGNLTPLGVANHLMRAGFNIDYAQKVANDLAKPASSPAPVRPIGNQGISDYQREIARNMAEGFAAWNAARQEALPSDEPASSPAGGDVATGLRAEIAHDGFTGDIIGRYVTREGKRGAVVQQDGTRVVHVYGEKWLPIETQMALSQSTSAGRVGE